MLGFCVNIPSCTSIAQNSGFMVTGVGNGGDEGAGASSYNVSAESVNR
ncbi:hypothetical protein [Nostoc sp. UHCC 0252]|nr:hypothetical protein [Nostoc sp. UHCC 0252]MEA5604971.1 hypothetical protein [Nostoc sp. UHCC 0252]